MSDDAHDEIRRTTIQFYDDAAVEDTWIFLHRGGPYAGIGLGTIRRDVQMFFEVGTAVEVQQALAELLGEAGETHEIKIRFRDWDEGLDGLIALKRAGDRIRLRARLEYDIECNLDLDTATRVLQALSDLIDE